jgi:hypothetical protein
MRHYGEKRVKQESNGQEDTKTKSPKEQLHTQTKVPVGVWAGTSKRETKENT